MVIKMKSLQRCSCGTIFVLHKPEPDEYKDNFCKECIINAKLVRCMECNVYYDIYPIHEDYHKDWSEWTCNYCFESDESIEVVHSHVSFVCPITMEPLEEDVLQSKKCLHIYSKTGIHWYLLKGKKFCPVAGCNEKITKSYLQPTTVEQSILIPDDDIIRIDLT